jgi:iron complex outermembrane recepter protein
MRTIFLLSSLVSLFFTNKLQAANVTGKITSNNAAVANASITMFNKADSNGLPNIGISNAQGTFVIENVQAGSYLIVTEANGYGLDSIQNIVVQNTDLAIPTISIVKKNNKIEGVQVVAKKPMIEVKADKTVLNIENNINAAGSNALDILRKSPGVTVDNNDNISLKGKSGVLIYIDSKQTYLDNATIASILKGTQSSAIESIELITNPSAKYDAAGNAGIINIKMKKNKKLGTNGTATLGFNYGFTPKVNASLNLNHNNKKTNYFGMYSMENGANKSTMSFLRTQSAYTYDQKNINTSTNTDHNFKLGADYFLNTKHTIGAMISGNAENGSWVSLSNTNIGPQGQPYNRILTATNNLPGNRSNVNGNVNYKYSDTNGTTLNLDIDAGKFTSRANSYQPNSYKNLDGSSIQDLLYKNNTPIDINIYTAKADYEKNALKGKVGLGLKSSLVSTKNTFDFYDVVNAIDILNVDRSNTFDYTENVNAGYINYNTMLNKKLSLQAGLRAEQTVSNGKLISRKPNNDTTVPRNYLDYFPSLAFSYTHSPMHSFALNFSRRIQRPNYQDLNPFENKLDELTYQKGNAFLKPQYTYSTDFTYTVFQAASLGVNHSYITDQYAEITDTALGGKSFITNRNLANSNVLGISLGSPLPIKKWWFAYLNLGYNYTVTKANFNGNKINLAYPGFNGYMENNFTLPKQWSASISGWYSAAGYWGGTFKSSPLGAMDIGFQKQLLQKKLNAKISFTDVFWSSQWHGVSNYAGLQLDARGNNESRQVKLTVSYKFGSNTIQQARNRNTGLEEEGNRIKGGK